MNPMPRVTIAVPPRAYDAVIENGALAAAGSHLRDLLRERGKLFVVTVSTVRKKWGKRLLASLAASGFVTSVLEMPDGEPAKKLATVELLAEKLVRLGADRNSIIVAFGGGVVGDVAGLLASIYMRGIDVVQVPTTVLAQVDAAIGGKTGVNLKAGKNLLGTFHQPRAVLIDPQVLTSLPEREYRAGLYEALKCGIIGSLELFQRFEDDKDKILNRDPALLETIITDSVKLKAQIVVADEREMGMRRFLNLGHTIGHALEVETGYRTLLHGEAVAYGMIAATNIALSSGKLDSVTAGRIADAVLGLGKLPRIAIRSRNVYKRLASDKKTRDGVIHFVLPVEIGKVEVISGVTEKIVLAAIDELRHLAG